MTGAVNDLPTEHGFPAGSKLFVYSEVIDRNDGAVKVDEYYDIGTYSTLNTSYCYDNKLCLLLRSRYGIPLLSKDRAGY